MLHSKWWMNYYRWVIRDWEAHASNTDRWWLNHYRRTGVS
jgi:hypothetical protein